MTRFRPNIVIEGSKPYGEDGWKSLRIGDVTLDYKGPCERCGVTLVAPGTERRGIEPLLTLRSYRLLPQPLAGGIAFGGFFKPRSHGRIRVGDRVEVPETQAVTAVVATAPSAPARHSASSEQRSVRSDD